VAFVRAFCASGKVAAVCHGPQVLIEADAVSGRTLTSWPSVRKDLRNAGARWIDREGGSPRISRRFRTPSFADCMRRWRSPAAC